MGINSPLRCRVMVDQHLKDFYIPDCILFPESEEKVDDELPSCPVIVFINSKSVGQLGDSLLETYRGILNEDQVFDLGVEAPDKVLYRIYNNLERLKSNGDSFAEEVCKRLRLIVAGGDGTAGWLLGVVSDLELSQPPPIATVPLGTGNNLPFSFGWGKKSPGTDRESVKYFLNQVKKAREMNIDSWHIIMKMKTSSIENKCEPIAPLELPHALRAFHRVLSSDSLNVEGYQTFHGGFWNYFSMGTDAEVSYAFHSERKLHPEKFNNQRVNQKTYAKLASLNQPSSMNIAHIAKVKIQRRIGGNWEELQIHRSIRSIVCLNLPSFSGGLNPWGTPNSKEQRDRNLTPPFVDDGFLEVVGFREAWHGLALLASNGHGMRLAQAHRIRFEFCKGAAEHIFMRIDGEPWKQPMPLDDDTVVVEISHAGQVNMLAVEQCIAKSAKEPSTTGSHHHDSDEDSFDEEDEWDVGRKKFGAADTFRIPDEVDISHLS